MPITVMYLDDEPELCEIFSDLFTSENIVVKTFTEPTMAISEAKANPPDVIFIDFRLPTMSGDKVAQALDSKIPKYLITGDLTVKSTYQFEKVLSKPCDQEEVAEILNKYLERQKKG